MSAPDKAAADRIGPDPAVPDAPRSEGIDDRLRNLINATPTCAIFMLSPAGMVASWNEVAERLFHCEAADIIGRPLANLYTADDRIAGRPDTALRRALAEGRSEEEGTHLRHDGQTFRAGIVIEPVRGEAEAPAGFVTIVRDISRHDELERTREQIYQSQKLEIVGQLTGGMAHDFNNMLTAILGCFDLVRQYTTDARTTRVLETGINAAARGQKMLAQLLAFARRQVLRPQPSRVNELIDVLRELLEQAVGETVQLRLDLDPAIALADLDQAQFQSALLNLVLNARDAMPQGGTLAIRTSTVDLSGSGHGPRSRLKLGSYVLIEVADTGIGMTDEVRGRAIEPFFTTKDVGRGSGLGLSQVFGFAEQSGGLLEIESEPGKGTTIRLLLPVAHVDSEPAAALRPTRRAVLVVEDDPDVLEVAVQMLNARGYEVYTAEDATQALSILQRETPIDVLFTDIVMPRGMNGVELARRAIHLRPNIGVLLASGYPRDALRARHGFADDMAFLSKPYRLATLDDALNELLTPDRPPET